MKKFSFIVLALICIFSFTFFVKAFSMQDKHYGVFIGMTKEESMKLEKFDPLIVEPSEFEADDIRKMHAKNKKIYAYLDIGSLENYRPYYERFKYNILAKYDNWEDEYWIDVSDKKWQKFIVDELGKDILDKGFDGFFIDNCDVYYNFQNEKIFDGLCTILKGLRKYNLDTIINGGDIFVSKCIDKKIAKDMFDGINQECVFTDIDFEHKTYNTKSLEEREYFTEYLQSVNSYGLQVFLLEYGADKKTLKQIENYCKENGFYWYNAKSLELR